MPRSLWNGTIAFGMVRVPVKLYSATESKAVRFRERHRTDGAAIEHRRICVQEGKEIPYGETVKGFEVSSGSYVTLSKEEIATADGPGAHMIEIEHFAGREEIDPVYYDRAYRLGPGKLGDESYLLLHAALKRSERVGIGRFVFHNKAHLVALRALEDVIALHTMRFADELVPAGDLEIPTPQRKPSKLEVSAARALVDQLSSSFQPDEYEDTYRAALLELIERKARGETIAAPEPVEIAPEDDLLGALQASLERQGRLEATGKDEEVEGQRRDRSSSRQKARRELALMPRPLWSGSLSFGLLNVPVDAATAPRATATSTFSCCTRRTARRSKRAGSARPRRSRCRGRRSPAATSSRTAAGCCSPTRTCRRPRPGRAARSTSSASSRSRKSIPSTSTAPTCSCPPTRAPRAPTRC